LKTTLSTRPLPSAGHTRGVRKPFSGRVMLAHS
jgi:hypothetical protein